MVENGQMKVSVVSPEGKEVLLMEWSKMHYLVQSTFFAVLKDAWKRCEALDGMGFEQLEAALSPKNMPWSKPALQCRNRHVTEGLGELCLKQC